MRGTSEGTSTASPFRDLGPLGLNLFNFGPVLALDRLADFLEWDLVRHAASGE